MLANRYLFVHHSAISISFSNIMNYVTEPVTSHNVTVCDYHDRLCSLVVRVPGYRSKGPGSISGATRFSDK
jgi:hypothetical protein